MFPLGLTHYIFGGILIGVAVAVVYILTGTHATQSSFLTSTLSFITNHPFFPEAIVSRDKGVETLLRYGSDYGCASLHFTIFT